MGGGPAGCATTTPAAMALIKSVFPHVLQIMGITGNSCGDGNMNCD